MRPPHTVHFVSNWGGQAVVHWLKTWASSGGGQEKRMEEEWRREKGVHEGRNSTGQRHCAHSRTKERRACTPLRLPG